MILNLPSDWEICKLEDISLNFQNGIGKNKEYYGKGVKVANIGDLYSAPKFVPKKYSLLDVTKKEVDKYRILKGDILFVRSSLKREGVAYCSKYDSTETCLFSSFMIRVTPNSNKINPNYLSYQLRSPLLRKYLINASSTATITNISQPNLKRIPVILPPLDTQKKIAAVLDKADQLRQKREKAIEKLDHLIQSVFLDMFGDPVTNPKGWEKLILEMWYQI